MARTIASLLEHALALVDEVGAGQTASAEDSDYVLNVLISLLAELSKREILYLAIDPSDVQAEDIPDEYWEPLAQILSADISPQYKGVIVPDNIREGMLNRLRRMTSIGPSYGVLRATFF